MKKDLKTLCLTLLLVMSVVMGKAQSNVIDEVIWVVGDQPILRSEVEFQRLSAEMNHEKIAGDPYTVIPEMLAINKLFLHQASIDSINVSEADVIRSANEQLNQWIQSAGSQEKLEEYQGMSIKQIRQEIVRYFVETEKISEAKSKILGEKKISPAEVRRYFKNMPSDSLPTIPEQVEVQILTLSPEVSPEEIDRVKNELMDYAKRVNEGEANFATLARLYSQDAISATQGGELGYMGRGELVPEFANVAFALTDPNTVSKIVQSEYGYHIIQFISRSGDKINVRHILRKPVVSDAAIEKVLLRLDSIANDIRTKKFTFEEAVLALSDDKDTRSNQGLMVNTVRDAMLERTMQTSRFTMGELPPEVAKKVSTMHVGEISDAFTMRNSKDQEVCAIVLLKNRIKSHKADITADFRTLAGIVSEKMKNEKIDNWIREKQKTTYISIKEEWRKKDFKYPGWIK